ARSHPTARWPGPSPRPGGHPERPFGAAIAAQQDIQSAGAAVVRTRAGERQNQPRPLTARQPGREAALQHRDLILRIAAAAVDDQHTALAVLIRFGEERFDGGTCLVANHAMEIEMSLTREITGAHPPPQTRIQTDG